MPRLSIMQWQRTSSQYIGILQSLDNFVPGTIKIHRLGPGESVLVGTLARGGRKDWYALAYDKADMDFEDARSRATATVEAENTLRAAGKPGRGL